MDKNKSKETQKDLLAYIDDAKTDGKMNRDQAFTIYGYASALVTLQLITLQDYQVVEEKLRTEFGLSIEDLDNVIG